MRNLSYAGTFRNPAKAGTIRVIEWLTGKYTLLKLIRQFEKTGVPEGQIFFTKVLETMGIAVTTPEEQIARIPATGPLVVVANHPHGLVDGLVMGELIGRVRTDYKILTRSLLTGIPQIEHHMLPVPFPHEENAREQLYQLAQHTEITAIACSDPLEGELPVAGRYAVTDGVSRSELDTADKQLRQAYATRFREQREQLSQDMQRLGIPLLQATTDQAPFSLLQTFYGDNRRGQRPR